ncbi:cell division protein FtsL [Paenibacillus shirakamiensis]|uniref:Cell division protein FtsL n=1 Tax=Paenibacillus shirakamiensis TaxID=1265935 RepID=A0ABS4JC13_9BACL|nr:hypothetical protein [Paenibacillus shirakamiensis]MBP1999215.1 cell division protein FtsL [Paenibacillus shirakamiensis]
MAYTRGNLAVKEKPSERSYAAPRYKETTKVVTKRAALPVGEKLLYMLTVMIVVAIAGMLIWQNASLYQVKYKIVQTDNNIADLKQSMSVLSNKQQQLEKAAMDKLISSGELKVADEKNPIYAQRQVVPVPTSDVAEGTKTSLK